MHQYFDYGRPVQPEKKTNFQIALERAFEIERSKPRPKDTYSIELDCDAILATAGRIARFLEGRGV